MLPIGSINNSQRNALSIGQSTGDARFEQAVLQNQTPNEALQQLVIKVSSNNDGSAGGGREPMNAQWRALIREIPQGAPAAADPVFEERFLSSLERFFPGDENSYERRSEQRLLNTFSQFPVDERRDVVSALLKFNNNSLDGVVYHLKSLKEDAAQRRAVEVLVDLGDAGRNAIGSFDKPNAVNNVMRAFEQLSRPESQRLINNSNQRFRDVETPILLREGQGLPTLLNFIAASEETLQGKNAQGTGLRLVVNQKESDQGNNVIGILAKLEDSKQSPLLQQLITQSHYGTPTAFFKYLQNPSISAANKEQTIRNIVGTSVEITPEDLRKTFAPFGGINDSDRAARALEQFGNQSVEPARAAQELKTIVDQWSATDVAASPESQQTRRGSFNRSDLRVIAGGVERASINAEWQQLITGGETEISSDQKHRLFTSLDQSFKNSETDAERQLINNLLQFSAGERQEVFRALLHPDDNSQNTKVFFDCLQNPDINHSSKEQAFRNIARTSYLSKQEIFEMLGSLNDDPKLAAKVFERFGQQSIDRARVSQDLKTIIEQERSALTPPEPPKPRPQPGRRNFQILEGGKAKFSVIASMITAGWAAIQGQLSGRPEQESSQR